MPSSSQTAKMPKKPFTTRLDPSVLALAEQLAATERRSVTAVIELALIEYAERHGVKTQKAENNP
ncbi:ribbon-helix-helix protein, CopG family [Mesorhizobium sp.]|uniref:ribbon-helix-helix protein, CopG family n=1 Tax=Mesorhizobium sp. TaxID=1871066 RepID=UPI0012168FD2|nr:ribbon-helix-helix protein, CopG family [Mesorhizobium sp.]TIQ03827.1 MAG: ribbon-helix-helix protein, CopG family [Mesorhizobium sp.]